MGWPVAWRLGRRRRDVANRGASNIRGGLWTDKVEGWHERAPIVVRKKSKCVSGRASELTRQHDQSAPGDGDRALDPFARARLPADFSRQDRVRLLAEVAQALLDGREPSRAAALFVGGAVSAWLAQGGRIGALERDFLRVAAPRSSRHTASELWRRECSSRGTTAGDDPSTMQSNTLCTEPDNET